MSDPRCGTVAGYAAHRTRKEKTCASCKEARRRYYADKRAAAPDCVVPACSKPQIARGYCSAHYGKAQRNGDPLVDARALHRNFWDRVSMGPVPDYRPDLGNCWLWTGSTHKKTGYGHLGSRQQFYAHRFVYEYMRAEIPEGLSIDHLCRVRNCVNPDHLEPVPLAENTRRAWAARKELAK